MIPAGTHAAEASAARQRHGIGLAAAHDVDVKALLRLAVLYNVPIACNRATADFLISSPLFADAAQLRGRREALWASG